MYPVSQAFQNAIDSNARRYYWTGVITTKGGQEYTFDNENIIKGSGYITRSCCGNSSLELGTVYASEMGITLLSDIDRYTLGGAQVKVYFHLVLPDDTVETVLMGIFEVSEATRKMRCLEIKAYDYMLRFDKAFNIEAGSGTAYNYLNIICEECGVEMAQTQAQIAALPNGTETLGIYSSNDIESYRDLLYYVAQVLGSVAQINREGKLELLQYTDTPVCKITQNQRYTSSYSDFITRYTAISSTNMVTEEAEYYALDTDDGLTMNLGTNPLLQFGLKATRERLLRRVLNAIAVAQYVPFTSDTIGNPALDPMDCLVFSGGHADDTKITCITSITYKINGKHSLKCVGKNPKLSGAKSKNDKNISGLLNQVVENKTVVYDFTNIEPLTLDESDTEVLSIDYVSKDGTSAMFLCEVLLNISAAETQKDISAVVTAADGTVSDATISFSEKSRPTITVTYAINGSVIETFVPKQTVCDGEYILTLFYPITSVKANSANYFTMFLSVAGGSATIGEGRIKATVSGQGLVSGVADWNGRIKMADVFTPYSLEFFDASLKQLTDSASVVQPNVTGTAVTSTLSFIHTQFALMTVIGINERVTADETVETFTVNATYPGEYDGDFVEITTDGVFARKTAYTIESEQAEIVSGSLEHLFVDTLVANGNTATAYTAEYRAYQEANTETESFLLRMEDTYYTIVGGALVEAELDALTPAIFLKYGFDELPSAELFATMVNPHVYCWRSDGKRQPLMAALTAEPFPQVITACADMSHESITGITEMTAQFSGNVTVQYSPDDELTFSDEIPLADFLNTDVAVLWENARATKRIHYRFILYAGATLTDFRMHYTN